MVTIPLPPRRRTWHHAVHIQNVTLYNLQQVSVTIPLKVLTVVTGVSGSGKSTLIKEVLYPALMQHFTKSSPLLAQYTLPSILLGGDLAAIQGVELVHQNPLGKSSRSNPATYLGLYDSIRDLFAQTTTARSRHYQSGHFSFNSEKGQCPDCRGEGQQKIDMQFMADIYLPCSRCKGSRFKAEIAEVTYSGQTIVQVLRMTVDEALLFFTDQPLMVHKLKVLQKVGLGYIQLGQSSSSLSGGEAQRLKLAYFLEKELTDQPLLFIFDEPTTGLHMHDVAQLLQAIQSLIAQGHTALVIEHHIDVIKSADWLIDLGPDGGQQGGKVVFTGRPEALLQQEGNHTAHYLKQKM